MPNGLEAYLNQYHGLLRSRGKARVDHIATPHRIQGLDGAGRFTSARAPGHWCDYAGCIEGGLMVALEAKIRSRDRLYRSDLEKHQREALADVHTLGGVAIVYARLEDGQDYIIPWPVLDADKSVHVGNDMWRRPPAVGGWYPAAEQWDVYREGGWKTI